MSMELSADLRRRAAVHSALGDPARLAVADALVLGDASPSELQARLGMPSNLLAHHVGVLERAGVLRRTRSEGDRRRTYLSLVPGVLDSLRPAATRTVVRVVFVCTENSARSQLAAALWRRHCRMPVASAGTRPAPRVHPGAVAAARRHQLPMGCVFPRQVNEVLRLDDFVITVCDDAHEQLAHEQLDMGSDWLHWSIADPARSGADDAFDQALADLTDRVLRVAPVLRTTDPGRPDD